MLFRSKLRLVDILKGYIMAMLEEYRKESWQRLAKKVLAYRLVEEALRNRELVRPDICEDCKTSGVKIQGHHEDYSKPLDINWVCVKCHRKRDKILRDNRVIEPLTEEEINTCSEALRSYREKW